MIAEGRCMIAVGRSAIHVAGERLARLLEVAGHRIRGAGLLFDTAHFYTAHFDTAHRLA